MLFIELFNNVWLGSIASTSAGKRVYNYCITCIYIYYIYISLNWSSELVPFLMFPACWNSSLAASLRCSMARSGTRVWFLMWLSRSSTTRPAPSPKKNTWGCQTKMDNGYIPTPSWCQNCCFMSLQMSLPPHSPRHSLGNLPSCSRCLLLAPCRKQQGFEFWVLVSEEKIKMRSSSLCPSSKFFVVLLVIYLSLMHFCKRLFQVSIRGFSIEPLELTVRYIADSSKTSLQKNTGFCICFGCVKVEKCQHISDSTHTRLKKHITTRIDVGFFV